MPCRRSAIKEVNDCAPCFEKELCSNQICVSQFFFQSYFKDPWNTFDFVTVVGSIVDALMVEFAVSLNLLFYTFAIYSTLYITKTSLILKKGF